MAETGVTDDDRVNTNLSEYASVSTNGDADARRINEVFITHSGRARARRRWVTVEFIVVLIAASFGGLATLKGQYIRMRVTEDLANGTHPVNSSSLCDMGNATAALQNEIQKETAQWTLNLGIASTFPAMFSTLIIGTLSERYGRKLAILLPCLGFLVQSVVSLCVVYLSLPLSVFYLGDFASGVSGGLPLFMAGCFTYIADITTEKQRMIRIVIVEILIFVGIGGMQIGLGYMIREFGFALSLWMPFAATVVSIVNVAWPMLLIETVSPTSKTGEERNLKSVFGDIGRLLMVQKDNRRWILLTLFVIGLLMGIITQGSISITVLYGQGQPFCWQSITIGFYTTMSLVVPGIGCVAGAAVFSWFKLSYMWVVQVSLFSCLANTLAIAMTFLVQSTELLFGSTFLGIFKLLGVPVIRTFLSTIVDKKEHGALFASFGVLDSLAMFVAPILLNGIYAGTVELLSTAVFFVMSAMLLIPVILTGILQCNGVEKKNDSRPLAINAGDTDDQRPLLSD